MNCGNYILFLILLKFSWNTNAFEMFEKDISIVNDSLNLFIQKGKELSNEKEYSKAIDVFNKALEITVDQGLSNDASLIYKNIGYIYYKQDQFNTSKNYYRKSITSDSLSQNAADSHFNLSLIYRKEKQSDSLLYHLYISLNIYDQLIDSKTKFSTYSKSGILFRSNGNYNEAIRYLLKAYSGFEELNNKQELAKVCNSIAATQRLLGNLNIAKQYYKEGLALRKKLGDSIQTSFAYNNLANLYKEIKQYDSATVFYDKAIKFQDGFNETKNIGRAYYNLGTVSFLQDDYANAKIYYRKSIPILLREGDSTFLPTTYNELALIAIKNNDGNTARKYLDSASVLLNPSLGKDVYLRHLDVKAQYFELKGDLEKALSLQREYNSLYEEIYQEKQAQAIQELQEQFESEKKLKRIQELTEGNDNQKAIISKQKVRIATRDWLLVIATVLILLAIAIYFLIRQRHKTKEKGHEIHRLESIFQGQEVVKEKISKDLHDIVTTSFDAIRLKIIALSKASDPDAVSKTIVNDIAAVNEQIRLISHRLSPLGDKIKDTSLTEIIEDQLTEFQYYRKIFVDIQLPLPEVINDFTLVSQTNLYGIILEILHNIDKHAQATEVKITHKTDDDILSLTIVDNGIGFNEIKKEGIGLLNMKQRAQLIHGECIIKSSNNGTSIAIQFPIIKNMK